jgi:membrane protease YdiL (CAAX protease family)
MTSPTKPRTPRLYHARVPAPGGALDAGVALAVAGCAIVGFLVAALVAPPSLALFAAQLAEAGVVAGMTAALVASPASARGAAAALGVAMPRPRFVVAALLIGATAWYLNDVLDELVLGWFGVELHAEYLEDLVTNSPLWLALTGLAVLPAVCEELVFRGAVARGLATRLPLPLAALASAAVFSAYHMSIVQALPTFVLGTLLAMIAVRGASIIPAMLAHAVNNAMAILVTRAGDGPVKAWLDDHVAVAASACAVCCAAGVALVVRGP